MDNTKPNISQLYQIFREAEQKSKKTMMEYVLPSDESISLFKQLGILLEEALSEDPSNSNLNRIKSLAQIYMMHYKDAYESLKIVVDKDNKPKDKALLIQLENIKDITIPDSSQLPYFKYHLDPIRTGSFKFDKKVKCDCCEKETTVYYTGPFYSIKDIDYLCPQCIANGAASEKFNGEFQDYLSLDNISEQEDINPSMLQEDAKINELIHRTPGYSGWQQEIWLSHCNDYCAFVGYVGWDEIKDILDDFVDIESDCTELGLSMDELPNYLYNGGSCQGYLFQCLHCKKYRLHFDFD